MQRSKKILTSIIAGLAVLVLVFVLAANWMVSRIVSAEFIAGKIEETFGVRARIGAVKASVFSLAASVEVREFAMVPKDAPDAAFADAPARLGKARVSVSLMDLLDKRINVSAVLLQDASVKVTLYADGSNSIGRMLGLPGPSAPRSEAQPAFNAKAIPVAASLGDLRLQNIDVDLTIDSNDALVRLQDFNLRLDQIGINPANLAEFNDAKLQLEGTIALDSAATEGLRYADLSFSGPVSVKVFDVATGSIDPNVTARISASSSSYLDPRVPSVQKAFRLADQLRQFGLDLGTIPERVSFDPQQEIAVNYHRGKITFEEAMVILLGDWQIDIAENAWIDVAQNTHALTARLVAAESLSRTLSGQLDSGLTKVPKEIRAVLAAEIRQHWFEQDRFFASVRSQGSLADPAVTLANVMPDPGQLLLRAGQQKAGELVKEKLEEKLDEKLGEQAEGLLRGVLGR